MTTQIQSNIYPEVATCCQSGTQGIVKHNPAVFDENVDGTRIATLSITGMHCGACASRIQTALMMVQGVVDARVDFSSTSARVRFDPALTDIQAMTATVEATGYQAGPVDEKPVVKPDQPHAKSPLRAMVIGTSAALGIIGFYLGLITLTSDWYNAKAQFGDYRWYVLALAVGLGLQVGLFVHLRAFLARARITGATSSVAASGGITTLSMALCCSHYVAVILPAIGLPFLSTAAAGLAEYQVQFFMLGVVSNILGILYMLRLMAKNGLIQARWVHRPA